MRPNLLLNPLSERHSRRQRPPRPALTPRKRASEPRSAAQPSPPPKPRDIAVERVRASGGPLDRASYSCQCGYLFAAAVSTTVQCPHCSAEQAW